MASFCFRCQQSGRRPSKAAVYGGVGCSPAVDLRRFEVLVAWCRHYEPVGNALFRKLMHVAFAEWCVPSPTNSPFNCSKTAKLREPPVLETGLFNPSFLDLSVTVTFDLQLFVLVHDFPLEQSFLSASFPPDPGHCSQTARKTLSRGLLDNLCLRFSHGSLQK